MLFNLSFVLAGEGEIDDEPVMESYELEFDIKKFLLRCCPHTMHTRRCLLALFLGSLHVHVHT